jgi:hypothetical protein
MKRFVIVAGADTVLVANTPYQLLRIEGFVADPCCPREFEVLANAPARSRLITLLFYYSVDSNGVSRSASPHLITSRPWTIALKAW